MSNLHSKYSYFSICDYSSKGTSVAGQQSRYLRGQVKKGNNQLIKRLFNKVIEMNLEEFGEYFNKDVSLVPVPRSHPPVAGAMIPAQEISNEILKLGHAKEVIPIIERFKKVNTSSMSTPKDRPTVKEHYDSFKLNKLVFFPSKITLVDDIITQGRTLVACALKILEMSPETEIRCFAVLKTRNLVDEIPELINPTFNIIEYFTSGKTFRHPEE